VSEAVLEAETGFLVPAEDPAALTDRLRHLLSNRDLAQRLGSAGRERAREKFTAEAMARSFETLYREILE
jgi:glycosyltransferase involved in cell wall biosynthesis